MRIYNFLEVSNRRRGVNYPLSDNNRRRHVLPLASGGEDMVELSDQAVRRHQKGQVIAMQRAKIEKIAHDLMPDIRSAFEQIHEGGDISDPKTGKINFTDQDKRYSGSSVVEDTADMILGFLAG